MSSVFRLAIGSNLASFSFILITDTSKQCNCLANRKTADSKESDFQESGSTLSKMTNVQPTTIQVPATWEGRFLEE